MAYTRRQHRAATIVLSCRGGSAAAAIFAMPMQIEALVLESVYPDVTVATGNRLALRLGRWARTFAPVLTTQLPIWTGYRFDEIRPIDWMGKVTCPVLVISGAADRHTTESDTRALFAAAPQPKALWLVPGAAHVDLHRFAGPAYETRVLHFLENTLDRQAN